MKQLIYLVFVIIFSSNLQAQSCFTYDAAGNRTKRSACVSSITNQENQEFQDFFKEEVESRNLDLQNDLEKLIVYPNPSSGIFNLIDQSTWIGSQITVYSSDGKTVYSYQLTDQAIDLLFLSNGSYYLTVKKDNIIKVAKIFITN